MQYPGAPRLVAPELEPDQTGADGVGGAGGAGAPIRCCHHLFATYTTACTNILQLRQTRT